VIKAFFHIPIKSLSDSLFHVFLNSPDISGALLGLDKSVF
jgi:hypothetical protein